MPSIETFNIPNEYEYYDEGTYVSPNHISHEAISRIKSRKIGARILGL